jgi:hypothetical protein
MSGLGGYMGSFSQQLILAIIGPLVSVIIGTLIIGGIAQFLADRIQNKRADDIRQLEQHRADHALRQELISEAASITSALHLATQSFWLVKTSDPAASLNELAVARKALDLEYQTGRTRGAVLDARLAACFATEEPRQSWHKLMDLMTVRYFQLIDRETDELYRANAKGTDGKEHSGLTVDDLKRLKPLLDTYWTALEETTTRALATSFRQPAGK